MAAGGPTLRARGLRRRMTFTEQKLWRELRELDANFRRQAPIGRYFADFATHNPKLVVEIDGPVHEVFAEAAQRDVQRQSWLEAQGYKVLRFTTRQVDADVFGCAEAVKRQLALLLDGGGLGGGVAAEIDAWREWAPPPTPVKTPTNAATPPSPTLPPSRRKGAPTRDAD
jgi:very-short-patch-repair endonuclease